MQALMRSVLKAVKKSMSDEAAFNAVVPEYDGEVSVQSLNRFQEELWSAAWAVMRANEQNAVEATDNVEGAVVDEVLLKVEKKSTDAGLESTASLTEYAYQQVAALPGNHEMKALVHRILNSEARNVGNAGKLTGAIHFYSGSREVQDLSRLNKKLCSVWWTNAGEGMTAPLSEKGYQAVAKMHNQLNMQALMRSVLKAVKKSMSDEAAFNAVVPEYDGEVSIQSLNRFQEELWSAAWAVMRAKERTQWRPPKMWRVQW